MQSCSQLEVDFLVPAGSRITANDGAVIHDQFRGLLGYTVSVLPEQTMVSPDMWLPHAARSRPVSHVVVVGIAIVVNGIQRGYWCPVSDSRKS